MTPDCPILERVKAKVLTLAQRSANGQHKGQHS